MPQFIVDVTAEILPKAKVEGIFRLNGTGEKVNTWKRKLNKGKKADYSKATVHDLVSLLKLYMRELPDPLIPYAHFDEWLSIASNVSQLRIKQIFLIFFLKQQTRFKR